MANCWDELGDGGSEGSRCHMPTHLLKQDSQFDPTTAEPSDRFREAQRRPIQTGQRGP